MRLIDAYKVRCDRDDYDTYADYIKAFDAINEAPTVDAVPVTRCKDCKWYEADFGCDWGVCFHKEWTTGSIGNGVDCDGYCFRAERKDNG